MYPSTPFPRAVHARVLWEAGQMCFDLDHIYHSGFRSASGSLTVAQLVTASIAATCPVHSPSLPPMERRTPQADSQNH